MAGVSLPGEDLDPQPPRHYEGAIMSARSSSPVLVTVLDTPAGPVSLLACGTGHVAQKLGEKGSIA